MIRVSVMYPRREGARFDHDYYVKRHIPLVIDLLGPAVHAVTVERGIDPGPPWPPSAWFCIASFVCDSLHDYQQAIVPHARKLQDDVANFTEVTPMIQVGELTDVKSPNSVSDGPSGSGQGRGLS
jgi:uncharacterized protein (TIGR02118 family)